MSVRFSGYDEPFYENTTSNLERMSGVHPDYPRLGATRTTMSAMESMVTEIDPVLCNNAVSSGNGLENDNTGPISIAGSVEPSMTIQQEERQEVIIEVVEKRKRGRPRKNPVLAGASILQVIQKFYWMHTLI